MVGPQLHSQLAMRTSCGKVMSKVVIIALLLFYTMLGVFFFLISHHAQEFIKNSINKWNGKILKE